MLRDERSPGCAPCSSTAPRPCAAAAERNSLELAAPRQGHPAPRPAGRPVRQDRRWCGERGDGHARRAFLPSGERRDLPSAGQPLLSGGHASDGVQRPRPARALVATPSPPHHPRLARPHRRPDRAHAAAPVARPARRGNVHPAEPARARAGLAVHGSDGRAAVRPPRPPGTFVPERPRRPGVGKHDQAPAGPFAEDAGRESAPDDAHGGRHRRCRGLRHLEQRPGGKLVSRPGPRSGPRQRGRR